MWDRSRVGPVFRPVVAQHGTPDTIPRRATPGVARIPNDDMELADTACVEWLCRHWLRKDTGRPWTVKQFEDEFMAARHYRSHGGPMNRIDSMSDLVERRELFKALRIRTENAMAARSSSPRPLDPSTPQPLDSFRPRRIPRLADSRPLTAECSPPAKECQADATLF